MEGDTHTEGGENELREVRKDNERLRAENLRLKSLLEAFALRSASSLATPSADRKAQETRREQRPTEPALSPARPKTLRESSESSQVTVEDAGSFLNEKIALFRSLFRGREDVYAVRWESRKRKSVRNVIVMRGGMGKKWRAAATEQIESVPSHEARVILATGRYAGEGFDDARLDALFLAMPSSWRGTLQQYVGRLHRTRAGKHEVRVYDYVDRQVSVLMRMLAKRLKGYRAMGADIPCPAVTDDQLGLM